MEIGVSLQNLLIRVRFPSGSPMKIFLICIIMTTLIGCALCNNIQPHTKWSNKEIVFVIVENGKTNNICVLTGLRDDGIFVWKHNRSGFEYNAKNEKDD